MVREIGGNGVIREKRQHRVARWGSNCHAHQRKPRQKGEISLSGKEPSPKEKIVNSGQRIQFTITARWIESPGRSRKNVDTNAAGEEAQGDWNAVRAVLRVGVHTCTPYYPGYTLVSLLFLHFSWEHAVHKVQRLREKLAEPGSGFESTLGENLDRSIRGEEAGLEDYRTHTSTGRSEEV